MKSHVPYPTCYLTIHIFYFVLSIDSSHGFSIPASAPDVPSWSDLSMAILPRTPPPIIDCFVEAKRHPNNETIDGIIKTKINSKLPVLYRERNGWCVHSARLWLAMEAKGILYNTVLVEARGDTFDGSPTQDEQDDTDGRPQCLVGLNLPQLCAISTDEEHELIPGADDQECMSLLEKLDEMFPSSKPIWPPLDDEGDPACKSEDISAAVSAFMDIAPGSQICRQSPRAAWLFCSEEGYRLDPLPRETFETVLYDIDALLGQAAGPFFAGEYFSAADIFWSPLLERYSAQLPCLHGGLPPRGDFDRWPNINSWYEAMDNIPAYVCQVRGDGPSWRKVLYREPWWPSEETWHPRDTVGPKGELKASEDEVIKMFGDASVNDEVWKRYLVDHSYRAKSPGGEAASCIIRNHEQISADFIKWSSAWGYEDITADEIDISLRRITMSLKAGGKMEMGIDHYLKGATFAALAAYFDDRICVPRDMGAPAATKMRMVLDDMNRKGWTESRAKETWHSV